jgi:hypothetical protein
MKYTFFTIAFTLLILQCGAQTVGEDVILLHSSQAINNGNTLSSANEFTIRGSEEIEWSQNTDAGKTTYTITGTSGAWQNLNTEGEVEFQVTLAGRSGKIFLYRNGSGVLKLRIDMFRNSVNLVPFEFIISSFEKLN